MASLQPIWIKIADFGTSKQTKFTALRTSCGTQGYIAPEVIGLIPRPAQGFTYALDMWSLGCLLHHVLTGQTPFRETTALTDDFMSGLSESDFEDQTDVALLHQYCQGEVDFPTEMLRGSGVSAHGIDLVTQLLNPKPDGRPLASDVRQHPWLANGELSGRVVQQFGE